MTVLPVLGLLVVSVLYPLVSTQAYRLPAASERGPGHFIPDRFRQTAGYPHQGVAQVPPTSNPPIPISPDLHDFVPPQGTIHPKLESALSQVVQAATLGQDFETLARWRGVPVQGNRFQAIIEVDYGATQQVAAEAASLGVSVQETYENLVQVSAPVQTLEALAGLSRVRFVRRPLDLYPQAVKSEGLRLLGAEEWQRKGLRGQGVKAAVVDQGFIGYRNLLGSELPEAVRVRSFVFDEFRGAVRPDVDLATEHGTAAAEILYDVAPQANLYLVAFSTEVELGKAVDWLIEEGVQVVSFSLGALAAPLDGSGLLDRIVDRAADHGILWVNAVGNYGKSHWEGIFSNPNGDGWNEFAPGNRLFPLEIGVDEIALIILNWVDWPDSSQDYGVYLFWEGVGGNLTLLGYSDTAQKGTQPPVESMLLFTLPRGRYYIAIKKLEATRDVKFHLYSLIQDFPKGSPNGSLVSPASARGALAVGATNGFDQVQNYSSHGPTDDGRIKPDLVAPDSVSTVTYGHLGFAGTSASTPHVAGAAALVLSAFPQMTGRQVQEYLESHALILGQPGKDNTHGSGRLMLGSAPEVPSTPTPTNTPLPTATATATPTPTGTLVPTLTPQPTATATKTPSPTPTVLMPSPTGVAWPDHFEFLPYIPKRLPQ